MLCAGFDVKTVAARGGWKDACVVLRTYAHAIEDRTVTDAIFRTKSAQNESTKRSTISKKGENDNGHGPSLGKGVPLRNAQPGRPLAQAKTLP